MTKLSLWNVAIELSAAAKQMSVSLDEIKDPAWIPAGDSGQALKTHLTQLGNADYAVVDIGNGDEWLTSRLYLLAAMSERMRNVRQIVFVAGDAAVRGRLVGAAATRHVRFSLAIQYPWLESTFAEAYRNVLMNGQGPISSNGALQPSSAGQVLGQFIMTLQMRGRGPANEYTDLGNGRLERAKWVTERLLVDILGPDLKTDSIALAAAGSNEQRIRSVLTGNGEMVPAVAVSGTFERLINRRELLERLGREVASSG